MSVSLTPSSTGTNLYNQGPVTYTPQSTVNIENYIYYQITVSFYVGYRAFYNGREYGFEVRLYVDSQDVATASNIYTYPDSNRGYVTATFNIGPFVSGNITAVTLSQTYQWNGNSNYYATSQGSNNTIDSTQTGLYYSEVSTPSNVNINGSTALSLAPNKPATLSWSRSSDGVNTSVSGYTVFRSINGGSYSEISTTTGTTLAVTSGATGTVYRYYVRANSSPPGYNSGNSSAVSLTSAVSAPSVPSNVRLDSTYLSSGVQTTLRWDPSTAGTNNSVANYTVYIDGVAQSPPVGTTSYTVTAASSGTRSFTVQANGAEGVNSAQSSAVTLYTYSAPGAPKNVAVAPTSVAPGATATLSWTAADNGVYNAVDGYLVHRSTNPSSGYTQLGSKLPVTARSLAITAPTDKGATYYYVIYATGERGGTSTASSVVSLSSYNYTSVGAPTTVSVSPKVVVSNGSATLSWSAGSAGQNTSVSSYWVYSSTDGTTYQKMQGGQTTGTSLSVRAPASGSIYFKVQSIANLTGYDSSLSTAYAVLSVNKVPTTPTDVVALPTLYETGNITVTWSASTDPEGQSLTYLVQYQIDNGEWTEFASGSNTSAEGSLVSVFPRGSTAKFRVRSIDTLGGTSEWAVSDTITRNTAPSEDSLVFTKESGKGTTYARRPKILVTIGGSKTVTVYAVGYTPSSTGQLTVGTQVVFTADTDQEDGQKEVTFTVTDTHGASINITYTYTVATPTYTDDPLIPFSITQLEDPSAPRATHVKAVHINELRTYINTVRSFYGLSSQTWARTLQSMVSPLNTWLLDIKELRTAITSIIAQVNSWDPTVTSLIIPDPTWTSISTVSPRVDVTTEIRNLIKSL